MVLSSDLMDAETEMHSEKPTVRCLAHHLEKAFDRY
jgi:hypothetical protein